MKQLRYGFLAALVMMMSVLAVGQTTTTIFTEGMGTTASTTAIATHETANGYDNDGYTMTQGGATNPADMRNSNASSGYAGVSGLSNVFFTSTSGDRGFAIEGIDASNYTNLTVQFGYRKESAPAHATFVLDYWNGSAYVNVPFTFNEIATAAIGWYLSPVISLPAGAQISTLKLRWVKSGTLSIRIDDVVLKGIINEPSTQTSNVTFANISSTQFDVNFTSGNGAGRVVVVKSGSAVDSDPADGTTYSVTANSVFGSGAQLGTGNYVVYSGTGNTVTVTNLTASTTYHVAAYEFNGSGTATNHKTASPATNNQATNAPSGSTASDIVSGGGEPSNIAYASYQSSAINTTSDGIKVASFTIRDGGGAADGDALGTELAAITISKGGSNTVSSWANTLRKAALLDGSTKVAEVTVSGETIAFSGLSGSNVTAADDGSKTLDLYVSFESAVTDNEQLQFEVTNSNVSAALSGTSGFTTFTAASSSVASNDNRIEVTATALSFTTAPAYTVIVNSNFSTTVKAVDVNGNTDLDASTQFNMTVNTGSINSTTGFPQNLVAGVYTYTDLQIPAATTSLTISTTNTGGLSNASTASLEAFDGLFIDNFSYNSGLLTSNGWSAISAGGTNALSASTSGLSKGTYEGSGIGNAVSMTTSGEDDAATFTSQTTGSVYASAMVRISAAQTTGDYFFAFNTNPTSGYTGRVFAKDDGVGGLKFGVAKATTVTYATGTYAYADTHLIVLKYKFNGGAADDEVSLYINPTVGNSEPGVADASGTSSETDASGVGSIALRQGSGSNAPTLIIDGIRVVTSWPWVPLPVELVSFTAIAKGRGVELVWQTATEVNNAGFEIQRSEVRGQRSEESWIKVGFVEGNGTTNAPKSYSFVDASAKGTVSYRLKQIDRDGQFEYSNVVNASVAMTAADYELSQNFPNPFNPTTNITFAMKTAENVNVTVYNSLGQAVATLFNDVAIANQVYTLNFDGKNLSSGTYFYALRSASRNEIRKMSLMK